MPALPDAAQRARSDGVQTVEFANATLKNCQRFVTRDPALPDRRAARLERLPVDNCSAVGGCALGGNDATASSTGERAVSVMRLVVLDSLAEAARWCAAACSRSSGDRATVS